jgi:benzil reductase ((S)-benzoin forming)
MSLSTRVDLRDNNSIPIIEEIMPQAVPPIFLITGASRGIGAALAGALNQRGASLFLVARGEIAGSFADAEIFNADLSRIEDVDRVLEKFSGFVEARPGASLTLINNAGTLAPIAPAHKCDAETVASAIRVNLLAPMHLSAGFIRAFADLDIEKRVVNISSGAASSAYAGWSTYCAAKAGLDHFTRCVGLEQEREDFPTMVISLAPGVVDTDMQSQIRASNEDDFPMLKKFAAFKASGSLPSPEQVSAKLLHFLDTWPLELGGIYDIRDAEPH